MNQRNLFLAVFLGTRDGARRKAWDALTDDQRRAREVEGIAAWKAWAQRHEAAIAVMGGPLGRTKRVSDAGIADVSNAMGAFTVVRAESHEAAARMFERHPHFTIFPGESIEIMPVLEIPSG